VTQGAIWRGLYPMKQGYAVIIIGTEGEGRNTVVKYRYPTGRGQTRRMGFWEFVATYRKA